MNNEANLGHARDLSNAVAVVGMALRVPDAVSPKAFWKNVLDKRISFETLDRSESTGHIADKVLLQPDYVPAGAFLDFDVSLFDARFFGLDERRARFMDPQQRLFLECCWEVLEHAGQTEIGSQARVGVYGGTSANAYLVQNLLGNPAVSGTMSDDDLELGGNKDHAALVAAYCLGLTGPAVTLQTCCSTSLLAVHMAAQSLIAGECDIALAGAMSLRLPVRTGYMWKEGSILSRNGQCLPFDLRADGTVFGSGGGVVALKPYADAIEDGDPIHAVILGSAVNNDGARKAGYVAPSLQGQRDVLAQALEVAGLTPREIGYIEAHGTGTAIGDAVEFKALKEVYDQAGDAKIALGTVKANIGHLDVASGVVGLINAIHVVRCGMIPGLAGFEAVNPQIGSDIGPFLIPTHSTTLEPDRRVAGVSSFGVGGTNVHVMLAAPSPEARRGAKEDTALSAEVVLPFERKRFWVDTPACGELSESFAQATAQERLITLINEVAITPLSPQDMERDFLDLGFDSLTLSQLAGRLRRETGLSISLLDLGKPETTPASLLEKTKVISPPSGPLTVEPTVQNLEPSEIDTVGGPTVAALGPYLVPVKQGVSTARPFTSQQRAFLDDFIATHRAKTAKSRALAEQGRTVMADPRSISGFDPRWKDICYPIASKRSAGAGFTDLDGNTYRDMVMGFGANYLGHAPPYVTEAIQEQIDNGYDIGPQTPLAIEVAEALATLTGVERVAFCNTGSEAVAAACRVARTATGRDGIVGFLGSYHGGFDAVLGRSGGGQVDGRALPIAPGIPMSALADMRLFEYGAKAALDHIASRSEEIAAVLVEPVQTRNPSNLPIAFLHDLRTLCSARGIALIFDEVVTGFRSHPGGAQALFDIEADLVTYGKVVGGGLPIGVLGGKSALLNHIDGGPWQFGDHSAPGVERTFLAGTFVRHPLAMVAARAALSHLAEGGTALTFETTRRVRSFCTRLNQLFRDRDIGAEIQSFSSFAAYKVEPKEESLEILFPLLRSNGIYIGDAKLVHFSVMHSDSDMDAILQAHDDCLGALRDVGLV